MHYTLANNSEWKFVKICPTIECVHISGILEYMKLGAPSMAMQCFEGWSFEIMVLFTT
jgi:hypothetical protein